MHRDRLTGGPASPTLRAWHDRPRARAQERACPSCPGSSRSCCWSRGVVHDRRRHPSTYVHRATRARRRDRSSSPTTPRAFAGDRTSTARSPPYSEAMVIKEHASPRSPTARDRTPSWTQDDPRRDVRHDVARSCGRRCSPSVVAVRRRRAGRRAGRAVSILDRPRPDRAARRPQTGRTAVDGPTVATASPVAEAPTVATVAGRGRDRSRPCEPTSTTICSAWPTHAYSPAWHSSRLSRAGRGRR